MMREDAGACSNNILNKLKTPNEGLSKTFPTGFDIYSLPTTADSFTALTKAKSLLSANNRIIERINSMKMNTKTADIINPRTRSRTASATTSELCQFFVPSLIPINASVKIIKKKRCKITFITCNIISVANMRFIVTGFSSRCLFAIGINLSTPAFTLGLSYDSREIGFILPCLSESGKFSIIRPEFFSLNISISIIGLFFFDMLFSIEFLIENPMRDVFIVGSSQDDNKIANRIIGRKTPHFKDLENPRSDPKIMNAKIIKKNTISTIVFAGTSSP